MTGSREALGSFAISRHGLDRTWRLDGDGYLHTGTRGSFVESNAVRMTATYVGTHP
ncbi:hypothetical protein [Halovivax cerinus]|uniref:Uncharacterized protein n=1 Tax=Halovivax cerinus TaxID=1487865 RepID=A0ABD5NU67_9EURY|nr:hypothetical protein [Halovivax cerinus]